MSALFVLSTRAKSLLPLTLTLGASVLVVTPFSCSSPSVSPDDAGLGNDAADDGAARDTREDATSDAAKDALHDADPDSGVYYQGIYRCCAEGQGRSCCPPETLPDPDAGRLATCFKYGGVRGACVGPNEQLEGKDICSLCCPGLSRVPSLAPAKDGPIRIGNVDCEPTNFPSVFGCTACGDGVCDEGENACNCPGDCGNPLDGGPTPDGGPGGDPNVPDASTSPEGGPVTGGPGGDASVPDANIPPPPPPPPPPPSP